MQDVRERAEGRSLEFHRQEVCGLRWSPDGQMLASGGNDNRVRAPLHPDRMPLPASPHRGRGAHSC